MPYLKALWLGGGAGASASPVGAPHLADHGAEFDR